MTSVEHSLLEEALGVDCVRCIVADLMGEVHKTGSVINKNCTVRVLNTLVLSPLLPGELTANRRSVMVHGDKVAGAKLGAFDCTDFIRNTTCSLGAGGLDAQTTLSTGGVERRLAGSSSSELWGEALSAVIRGLG